MVDVTVLGLVGGAPGGETPRESLEVFSLASVLQVASALACTIALFFVQIAIA